MVYIVNTGVGALVLWGCSVPWDISHWQHAHAPVCSLPCACCSRTRLARDRASPSCARVKYPSFA